MIHQSISTDDGLEIKLSEFCDPNHRATIIIVHGMAEHRKRYNDFANFLNEHEYNVITYDHRGHGESLFDMGLGYLGVNGFDKMIEDLDLIVEHVKENYPKKKIFLFGHSMGSFVVQGYVQRYKKVSGVILSGSSFRTFGMGFMKTIAYLQCLFGEPLKPGYFYNKMIFGKFNQFFRPTKTDFDWLNRDEKAVEAYCNDPLCGQVLTRQFYYDFIKGLITIQKAKHIRQVRSNLPIYILSGDQDPVGGMGRKVKALYEAYRQVSTKVELKLYQGARHEILHELNRDEVYQDVLKWLDKNI